MRTEKITPVKDTKGPDKFSLLLAVIVASLLSIGFSLMLGTAFRFSFSTITVIIWGIASSLVFAVLHFINNKYVSLSALVIPPLAFLVMISLDFFDMGTAWNAVLYYVQKNAFYNLPGEYKTPANGRQLILTFLMLYNLTAISITTFTIIKRKFIPLSLVLYIPVFILSVINILLTPSQAPVICTATGVISILLIHAFHNKKRVMAERTLLILLLPAFIIAFGIGAAFPKKGYHQDHLAKIFLADVKEFVGHVTSFSDNAVLDFIDTALNGVSNPDADREFVSRSQFTALYPSNKDLNKVGPFNPSSGKVFTVYKSMNESYDGDIPVYTGACAYYKVESLDTYRNNTLSRANVRINPYKDDVDLSAQSGQYSLAISPLSDDATIDIIPYYTDLYVEDGSDFATVSCYNTIDRGDNFYMSSPIPVRGDIYSDEYIEDYVYDIALEVPERTRDAIAMSGDLPDWYIECYLGTSTMSDCDKVRAVTQFVSSLHPYDRNTEYTPKNVDFVPWFISDAESGICVHYAATTVVLLRMIGIPARYVTGFMDVRSYPDTENIVYAEQAHAWFEFFVPGYGWIMGDATPGNATIAANFNIDAVSAAYPEIEEVSFSRNRYGSNNQTPVATEAPEETATMPSATYSVDESGNLVDEAGNTVAHDLVTFETTYDDEGHIVILPNETPQENTVNIDWEEIINKALAVCQVLLEIILVMLAFCIIKGIYTAFWFVRFGQENNGDKVIAYYHYFKFTNRFLGKRLPSKAIEIVEKVAYSHEEITKEDVRKFIKYCSKSTSMLAGKLPFYKKLLFSFLVIKLPKKP